jgi:hypothetical protein
MSRKLSAQFQIRENSLRYHILAEIFGTVYGIQSQQTDRYTAYPKQKRNRRNVN